MSNWQPIETAPKDGSVLVGIEPFWPNEAAIQWSEARNEWGVNPSKDLRDGYCVWLYGETQPIAWRRNGPLSV